MGMFPDDEDIEATPLALARNGQPPLFVVPRSFTFWWLASSASSEFSALQDPLTPIFIDVSSEKELDERKREGLKQLSLRNKEFCSFGGKSLFEHQLSKMCWQLLLKI